MANMFDEVTFSKGHDYEIVCAHSQYKWKAYYESMLGKIYRLMNALAHIREGNHNLDFDVRTIKPKNSPTTIDIISVSAKDEKEAKNFSKLEFMIIEETI